MSDTKTFEGWEEESGFIVIQADPDLLGAKMTRDQFIEQVQEITGNFWGHGVNHAARREFLKNNGYEITRENMVNPDLSAR